MSADDAPHMTWEDPCNMCLEWWHGSRKLTLFVSDQVDYLKVWGPDVNTEMEDGTVGREVDSLYHLFAWLRAGE